MHLSHLRVVLVLLLSSVATIQGQMPVAPPTTTSPKNADSECTPAATVCATQDNTGAEANDLQDNARDDVGVTTSKLSSASDTPPAGPSVAVIGCGPSGMFFLHALATKRKQLQEANDIEGLKRLPQVTVYEKSSSPGGVWKSDRNCQDEKCTNMYEGLWTNGVKELIEFHDYTFEEHFKGKPQPTYLPRKKILEYILARVTKYEDIFEHVMFNTLVTGIEFDEEDQSFKISYIDSETQEETYDNFDKCIWASGLNGIPHMPTEVMEKLTAFKGHITHSSQMDELFGGDVNGVKGKNILMVGDAYSAEDLTLQMIKLGAKEVCVTSRNGRGEAAYVGSWPRDAVDIVYGKVAGVADNGRTIMIHPTLDGYQADDIEDVDIIIFCTGYVGNWHFIDDGLYPDDVKGYWSMDEIENLGNWSMKQNALSGLLGHVEPSKRLLSSTNFITENSYKKRIIDHPDMMYIYETYVPLLDIDINAWLCLTHILETKSMPTKQQMLDENKHFRLEAMQDSDQRYLMDDKYAEAWDKFPEVSYSTEEYRPTLLESYFYLLMQMSRSMIDANYPIRIGDADNLNALGNQLLDMMITSAFYKYNLGNHDSETKHWQTFRDIDPSPFKSIFTGMPSIPFKSRWMDIEGEEYEN